VEKEVANVPSVHEQEDGVILAVCATGTSSHDSVLSWIRFLVNPSLLLPLMLAITIQKLHFRNGPIPVSEGTFLFSSHSNLH